jgi:hypothetical protein
MRRSDDMIKVSYYKTSASIYRCASLLALLYRNTPLFLLESFI